MKTILLTAVTFLASVGGVAHAKPTVVSKTSSKIITCNINEIDDATGVGADVARVTITLDDKGVASQIHLQSLAKKGSAFMPDPVDMQFDNTQSLITHGVRPNKVVDHDDGKLVFDWGIARVEFVTALNENGDSLEVDIRDHTYSGIPGSTIIYKKGDKNVNSANMGSTTFCSGAVKLK